MAVYERQSCVRGYRYMECICWKILYVKGAIQSHLQVNGLHLSGQIYLPENFCDSSGTKVLGGPTVLIFVFAHLLLLLAVATDDSLPVCGQT